MVLIELCNRRSFSVGVWYRGKTLSNYTVKKLDVGILFFTISFVYTKYNL